MLSLFIKFAAWWELSAQRFPIFPSQWSRRTCGGPVAQVYMECVRASRCFPDQKKHLPGLLASWKPRFPPDFLVGVCSPPEFEVRGARVAVRSEVNRVSTPRALARPRTPAWKKTLSLLLFSPRVFWLSFFPFDFLPGEETQAVLERVPCPEHTEQETRVKRQWQLMKTNTRRSTECVNMGGDKPKKKKVVKKIIQTISREGQGALSKAALNQEVLPRYSCMAYPQVLQLGRDG